MEKILFVTAQPDVPYFIWQIKLYVNNFIEKGINPNQIHVIFSIVHRNGTPSEESFINSNPKSKNDNINSSTREPFPQAPQRKSPNDHPVQGVGGRPPMIPQSSSGDDKNVDDAYNELLARRKTDVPNDSLHVM